MERSEKLIADALEYARQVFDGDSSGHDFYHTLRVWKLTRRIAQAEGADLNVAELAAILHDVDDHKLSPTTAEEKQRAVEFLRSHGVEEKEIVSIVSVIRQISFSRNTLPPDTLEGKCVQDADRLDAMGAVGIARTFAFGGSRGRPIHDPSGRDRGSSIAHFYEKLLLLKDRMNTPTGMALAQERHAFLLNFLQKFYDEWDGIV